MLKLFSKNKKLLITLLTTAILIGGFYIFINYVAIGFVNAHTITKHGDIVTIQQQSGAGLGSPATFHVKSVRNPKLQYTVHAERSFFLGILENVTGDTYEDGQTTYQEQLKLDTVTEDIKQLGFRGSGDEDILLGFIPTHRNEDGVSLKTLHLASEDHINFRNFKETELPRLHQLMTLIHSSDADVARIYLNDAETHWSIHFDGYASTTVLTQDELYAYLRQTNNVIGNHESQERWKEEFEEIENERFVFGFDTADLFYHCTDSTETGTCTDINVTVRYEHLGLTPDDEHLLADVTAILNLLDNTMQEINTYDLLFIEQNDEGEWFKEVRFTNQERDQFGTVEELIEEMF